MGLTKQNSQTVNFKKGWEEEENQWDLSVELNIAATRTEDLMTGTASTDCGGQSSIELIWFRIGNMHRKKIDGEVVRLGLDNDLEI